MTLSELSRDEKLALVALTEVAVISDPDISEGEIAQIDDVVNAIGEDEFRELAEEAEALFEDRDVLKTYLKKITSQDARELIYSTVLSEVLADTPQHAEADLLEWLAAEWKVPVNIDNANQ